MSATMVPLSLSYLYLMSATMSAFLYPPISYVCYNALSLSLFYIFCLPLSILLYLLSATMSASLSSPVSSDCCNVCLSPSHPIYSVCLSLSPYIFCLLPTMSASLFPPINSVCYNVCLSLSSYILCLLQCSLSLFYIFSLLYLLSVSLYPSISSVCYNVCLCLNHRRPQQQQHARSHSQQPQPKHNQFAVTNFPRVEHGHAPTRHETAPPPSPV